MTDHRPLEPRIWALNDPDHPETGLAHQGAKSRFWTGPIRNAKTGTQEYLDVTIDQSADVIFEKKGESPCTHKEIKPGDPDTNYDHTLSAQMDHQTPQFNLRNVMRYVLDADTEYMQWDRHDVPDRRGYNDDLEEVRNARHDAPDFESQSYATMALVENQSLNREVFILNDWEKWYGEDKKRVSGSLWAYVPEDGGKRTRPFPKDMPIVPHKFWKGRMITQNY